MSNPPEHITDRYPVALEYVKELLQAALPGCELQEPAAPTSEEFVQFRLSLGERRVILRVTDDRMLLLEGGSNLSPPLIHALHEALRNETNSVVILSLHSVQVG